LLEGEAGKAMSAEDRKVAFDYKSVWRRMAIVAAGPVANYLFAALIFTVIYAIHGKEVAAPVIGETIAGSAAAEAGLQPGDRIVSLNGTAIDDFNDIAEFVQLNLDQEIAIGIERSGTVQTVQVQPTISIEKDALGNEIRLGRLGIKAAGKSDRIELGAGQAVYEGVTRVFDVSGKMLKGVWQIVTGVRPADEVGGVLRFGYLSGEIAQIGIWQLIMFAAMLSVNQFDSPLVTQDPSLQQTYQRFMFPFTIAFTGDDGFTSLQANQVVFVTLNVQGSNNNVRHPEEHGPRMAAVHAWLDAAAGLAEQKKGLVVLMHHRQESGRDGGGGRPASRQPALLCASLPKMKV